MFTIATYFLSVCEAGEYEDHRKVVRSVHSTREASDLANEQAAKEWYLEALLLATESVQNDTYSTEHVAYWARLGYSKEEIARRCQYELEDAQRRLRNLEQLGWESFAGHLAKPVLELDDEGDVQYGRGNAERTVSRDSYDPMFHTVEVPFLG